LRKEKKKEEREEIYIPLRPFTPSFTEKRSTVAEKRRVKKPVQMVPLTRGRRDSGHKASDSTSLSSLHQTSMPPTIQNPLKASNTGTSHIMRPERGKIGFEKRKRGETHLK